MLERHEVVELHNCNEIKKLRNLLESNNLEHDSVRRFGATVKGYEIYIPNKDNCDFEIVEETGCLGYFNDKLEIVFFKNNEAYRKVGFLTAEESLSIIQKDLYDTEKVG